MVFPESPLRDAYRVLVWDMWRPAAAALPAGWELRGNRLLGRAALKASRGKRDSVIRNVARGLPDADHIAITKEVFSTHFADQYVSWTFARIAKGERYLELRGREHLDMAMAAGRGAVLMHPHMGLAQLPLCTLGMMGYPVHQIGGGGVAHVLSPTGERVTRLRHRLEQDIHGTIWDGGRYLRPVLRTLAGNGVVLAACDGTGGGRELGRRVTRQVLGQPMRIPVGPVWLALRSGATLLGLRTFHDHGHEVAVIEALPRPTDLDEGADLVATCLDRWLRAHPGQWHLWDEFEPGLLLC